MIERFDIGTLFSTVKSLRSPNAPPSAVALRITRARRSVAERAKMGKTTFRKSERRRKVQR